MIHREAEAGWLEGIVFDSVKDHVYNFVDFTAPMRRIHAEYMKANPDAKGHQSVLNQFLSNLGNEGKAMQFLENHPFTINRSTGEVTIHTDKPGFMTIISPMIKKGGTSLKEFEGYLIAKRNIELKNRGMTGRMTVNEKTSMEAIKSYEAKIH